MTIASVTPIRNEAPSYIQYLYALGLSERTIAIYERSVERFMVWCTDEGIDPMAVTPLNLAHYAQGIPMTTASRRQHRVALRHFYESAGWDSAPVGAIRVPPKRRYLARPLEPDEAQRLADTAEGWHPEGTAVMFGLYLGFRRREIASARWDRFDPELEGYTVLGKGDVTAWLPVHPRLADQVRDRTTYYVWIFPGVTRMHINDGTIGNWIREVGDAADVPGLTPHRLRHTAISTINDMTGDIRAAQEFARHASLESTQIYTRVTKERLQRAVAALDH